MRTVLAIDGGTVSGWALWREDMPKPRANTVTMPDTDNIGRFCGAMEEWLIPFARLEGVTDIIVEAPIIAKHKRAGAEPCPTCGQTKSDLNAHAVDKLFGIVHAVALAADKLGLTCPRVPRGTVVKHIAGIGRGTSREFKRYCMVGCQRLGWNVSSEDIADALATLNWFTWDRRIKTPWNNQPSPGPLFTANGVRPDDLSKAAANRVLTSATRFERDKG